MDNLSVVLEHIFTPELFKHQEIKRKKKHVNDLIISTCKLPLLFAVEKTMPHFAGYQSSLQVLYSTCKTPASSAKKTMRNIPQVPERILDAPEILDDYCMFNFCVVVC